MHFVDVTFCIDLFVNVHFNITKEIKMNNFIYVNIFIYFVLLVLFL